jgi:L-lysine exporter family protein LysE/ArgO
MLLQKMSLGFRSREPQAGEVSPALLAAASGFALGLGLIVAIGAQNAFVLRQGLRGEHVAAVVAVCAVSDVALITAGVAGTGALVDRVPAVVTVMRWAGAAVLAGYGALAARRALRSAGALQVETGGRTPLLTTALTAAALTWLNPHVYLDTVVLLGSVAATQGELRWYFGAGAAVGSVLWFSALGAGARLLRPAFARPGAWRLLDAGIALGMVALAVALASGG